MSDVINSAAFQEFLQKRCEEIIESDEACKKINREILELEKELLPALSKDALDKVLKIDELTMELINQIFILFGPIILR
jgi:hypothetical protein